MTEKYKKTVDKCSELEKEVLVLNQEKKVLREKTSKYDQLLDQKRRIEDIINQMKSTEVMTNTCTKGMASIPYLYLKMR